MAERPHIRDLQSHKALPLYPNQPVVIGRGGHFDLRHASVSRKHLRITLHEDGRCFVERLSSNKCTLENKEIPRNTAVEVKDRDIINLIPDDLPFEFVLPSRLSQPTTMTLAEEEDYSTQRDPTPDYSTADEEEILEATAAKDDNQSLLSTESSLLGSDVWQEHDEAEARASPAPK